MLGTSVDSILATDASGATTLGQEVVPQRIKQMEEAVKTCDFEEFAKLTCADSNQFHATCLDTSPPIFYLNDISRR